MYLPDSGNFGVAFRERVLEDVRATEFPEKPSRLSVCFLLPSLEEANKYRDHPERRSSIIYEVEPTTEPSTIHEGDWTMSLPEPDKTYFDGMSRFARQYWAGQTFGNPEILLPVPVRIVRCVDSSVPNLPGLRGETKTDESVTRSHS